MQDQTTNNQQIGSQNNNSTELESIKNEIANKMNDKTSKNLSWNNTLVMVILGVLTVVSIGQMVESIYIFNKLKSGNVAPSTSVPQINSPQNAPDMVGGC